MSMNDCALGWEIAHGAVSFALVLNMAYERS